MVRCRVVTISKSVTIDATGVFAGAHTIIGNVINIVAGASDVVVLRNLSINGLGKADNGIKFISGKALYLEGCVIKNFRNYGIDFEPSIGGTLVIGNSIIINNGAETTRVLGTGVAAAEQCWLSLHRGWPLPRLIRPKWP